MFGDSADVKIKSLLERVRANDITSPEAKKKYDISMLMRTTTPMPPVWSSEGLCRREYSAPVGSLDVLKSDAVGLSKIETLGIPPHFNHPRHTLSTSNFLRAPKPSQLSYKHYGSSTLPNCSLDRLPRRDTSVWSFGSDLRGNLANLPRGTTTRSRTLPPLKNDEKSSSASFRHGQNFVGGTWDSTAWKNRLNRPFGAHNREQSLDGAVDKVKSAERQTLSVDPVVEPDASPHVSFVDDNSTSLDHAEAALVFSNGISGDIGNSPIHADDEILMSTPPLVSDDAPWTKDGSPDASFLNDNSTSLDHAEAKEALVFSNGISGDIENSPIYTDDEIPMSTPPVVSDDVPWTREGKPIEDVFRSDGMSVVEFGAASDIEQHHLADLFQLQQPATVGTGNDVKTGWKNKGVGAPFIKIRAIWKVTRSAVLNAYEKELNELAQVQNLWVPTIQDELQRSLRHENVTKQNEYWMLHGADPRNLKSILKTGLNNAIASQTSFNFGRGTYLTDAADKLDQHTPPDTGLKYITSVVGPDDQQLLGMKESIGSICIALVVRAALGKHVELQIAEQIPINKALDKNNVGERSDFYWKDPYDESAKECTKVSIGTETHKHRVPPFGHFRDGYDSVKVMCGKYNPKYQAGWSESLEEGSPVTNAFPFRFNEYLVPFTRDHERSKPRVAVQYLVAYERLRRKEDGTETGA